MKRQYQRTGLKRVSRLSRNAYRKKISSLETMIKKEKKEDAVRRLKHLLATYRFNYKRAYASA